MDFSEEFKKLKELEEERVQKEDQVTVENKKYDEEINNIKSIAQKKIDKINKTKKEKTKNIEKRIIEIEKIKSQIIGNIASAHLNNEISQEEFNKLSEFTNKSKK
ncbi:hypothetical protein ACNSOL_11870 (plasmid) [Aliarcobacter lanthieri]|uniref:hypothetical protein n=1 Tax=Aliarcobacter lanthieri TaxID=1355374 RepID=UPI003AAFD005